MFKHILEGFDMTVKNWLNYDKKAASLETGLACLDKSLAVQGQKDEADINTIVRNFGVTGRLPEAIRIPTYGDFDGVSDYREAIEAVRAAEESFGKLPSELRAKLQNDPQKFLEYCADPGNVEEMRKLGLAAQVAAPEAPKAE